MHVYDAAISRNFVSDNLTLVRSEAIIITSALVTISFICTISMSDLAKGQQASLNSSNTLMKVLVGDAIKALEKDNTTKMLQNLNVVNGMLMDIKENSSSVQAIKLLVHDAIQAVYDRDVSRALVYLNLVGEQFGIQQSKSEASNEFTAGVSNATNSDFLTYEHQILGIKMQYPHDWKVRQYEYDPSGNNTLAGFYSLSKTASELGNISGVSGHFIPYADIFVFDSKNFTLDEIITGRLNRLQNDSHFTGIESKPFTLNNGQPAWSLIYRSTAGGDELFKKIQVYTVYSNKVFLISFTSQDASFPSYQPTIQKMIKSFDVNGKSTNNTG
jgi:PsbP-like protein